MNEQELKEKMIKLEDIYTAIYNKGFDDDFKKSLGYFYTKLDEDTIASSFNYSVNKFKEEKNHEATIRYFCAICRNKIKEISGTLIKIDPPKDLYSKLEKMAQGGNLTINELCLNIILDKIMHSEPVKPMEEDSHSQDLPF